MASPRSGSWLPTMEIKPRPESFITFFRTRHAACHAAAPDTRTPAAAGTRTENIDWASLLAVPKPHFRQPAWRRVATKPQSTTLARRNIIMKRVGMPTRSNNPNSYKPATRPAVSKKKTKSTRNRITRRRLGSYQPADEETELDATPPSAAEIARSYMEAKVDVANCLISHATTTSYQDMVQSRSGQFVQTVPAKRRAGDEALHGRDGNIFRTYLELWPILEKAGVAGVPSVDLVMASIAEVASTFQGFTRSPRKRVAQQGAPELSDIADETERDNAHIASPDRVEQSKIVLLSPVVSEAGQHALPETPNTARVFRAPSYSDSTTVWPLQEHIETPPQDTYERPLAPTPSKWTRIEPDTPHDEQQGAGHNASPLGLVAAVAPSTPLRQRRSLASLNAQSPVSFNFGRTSPSFNSVSWLSHPGQAEEIRRATNANHARRRRSEPLLRSHFRRRGERLSMSSNSVNRADDVFAAPSDTALSHADENHLDGSEEAGDGVDQLVDTTVTSELAIIEEEESVEKETSSAQQSAPPRKSRRSFVNIDMRRNPDIFGAHQTPSPSVSLSVTNLARMAEDRCGGEAKVVVTEDNGRLFVRFKLPAKFTTLFPSSQGLDESRFSTSPSAISSSPKISFKSAVAEAQEGEETSSLTELGEQPTISGLGTSIDAPELGGSLKVEDRSEQLTPGRTRETSPVLSGTPDRLDLNTNSPLSSSLSSFVTVRERPTESRNRAQPSPSPQARRRADLIVEEAEAAIRALSPERETQQNEDNAFPQVVASTPSPRSFTPVNQGARSLTPQSARSSAKDSKNVTSNSVSAPEAATKRQQYEDDSPGRAYMRDFIKRSKPKHLSTSETGSPVPYNAKRAPLGDKSPNMGSPQKAKRKLDEEILEPVSPVKKKPRSSPKKTGRNPKGAKPSQSQGRTEDGDTMMVPIEAIKALNDAEDEGEIDEPGTRRSSRLRNQAKPSAAKSAIPTAIKWNRSGASGPVLNAAVRSEQQDLTYQTRTNTRKNKGNAEYPLQVLARLSDDSGGDSDEPVSDGSDVAAKRGKNVCWKTPLVQHHEEKVQKVKGKAATTAIPKKKVTLGETGIAKPPRPQSTPHKQRTVKLAESLGMAGNGTPAKPQRLTRSRTRIPK